MFYRVKQFYRAITATISFEDKEWIENFLSLEEQKLFYSLRIYEQKHCLEVAKLLDKWTEGKDEMIRLGLLHDIGKTKYPLNPIEKSIIVLLDKFTKGKVKKLENIKMVKCFYEHPFIGCELLARIDQYDQSFLECISLHHNHQNAELTKELDLLVKADNLC